MTTTPLIALAVIIFCHVVILTVLLWIFCRFLNRFWNGRIAFRTEKMLAVGIVSYLFKDTVANVISLPASRFIFTLQRLYYTFYDYSVALDADDFGRLNVTRPITEGLFQYDDIVNGIPFANLFLAFGLTLLLYHLFKMIRVGVSQNATGNPANLGSRKMVLYNSVIAIVLLVSLYFVISVFVAIPYLNELRKPSTYTKVIVDSTLNNINRATQPLKPVVFIPLPKNISLDSAIQSTDLGADYNRLTEKVKIQIKAELKSINSNYERVLVDRSKLIDLLNNLVNDDVSSRQNAVFKSGMTFQTSSTNIALDKALLFRDLIANFDGFLRIRERNYETLSTAIKEGDVLTSRFVKDQVQRLSDKITSISRDSISAANYLSYGLYDEFRPYNADISNYEAEIAFSVPVKDGSDWGLLGHISGYLIKAQSQDLIIIIGMIGFGILGASILSFNNMSDFFKSVSQEAIISNFPSVLARGFGAALIIYLATKGGLAIFSGGANTDPNGYILLLTCFVGAVFSEKVWNKATVVLLTDHQKNSNGNP